MSRVRGWLFALVLTTVAVVLAFSFSKTERYLVVRTDGGALCEAFPLASGDSFALSYVHSMYGEPAEERFTVEEDGRLRLVGVSSPSQAVLEYYGPGARDPGIVPAVAQLLVIADRIGRRTLEVDDRRIPLYLFGDGVHLTLQVERWSPWRARLAAAFLRAKAAGRTSSH